MPPQQPARLLDRHRLNVIMGEALLVRHVVHGDWPPPLTTARRGSSERERESRARQRLLVHARARAPINVTTRQPIQRNYAPAATKQAQRRRSVPTEPAGRKCCRTSGAAGASNPHAAVQTGGRPLCRCLCPKRKRMPRSIRKTVDHEGWFGPFARQPDNVGQARSVSTKLVSETVVREP
jgi:hypothetical protein